MHIGDSTVAHIERQDQPSQHPQSARLQFNFQVNGGTHSGWGWDNGYYVRAGSLVPIFFEAKNPKRRLLASEPYFEVVEDGTNN